MTLTYTSAGRRNSPEGRRAAYPAYLQRGGPRVCCMLPVVFTRIVYCGVTVSAALVSAGIAIF